MNQETQSGPLKIAPRPVDDHAALQSHPTDAANISNKHSQNDSTGSRRLSLHLALDPFWETGRTFGLWIAPPKV